MVKRKRNSLWEFPFQIMIISALLQKLPGGYLPLLTHSKSSVNEPQTIYHHNHIAIQCAWCTIPLIFKNPGEIIIDSDHPGWVIERLPEKPDLISKLYQLIILSKSFLKKLIEIVLRMRLLKGTSLYPAYKGFLRHERLYQSI